MRYRNLQIGAKLAVVMVLLNGGITALLSFLFFQQFQLALNERVLLQLSSILQLKKVQIERLLEERQTEVRRQTQLPAREDDVLFDTVMTRGGAAVKSHAREGNSQRSGRGRYPRVREARP